MLDNLRKALVALNAAAEKKSEETLVRKAAVIAAKFLRNRPGMEANWKGFLKTAEQHERETSSWISAESLRNGDGGPFDACDLRHWLALSEMAGVPFVPAREILALDEAEMSLLSGSVEVKDTAVTRNIRKHNRDFAELVGGAASGPEADIDAERLVERLHSAMDDIPEGWMVRFVRCGSSELKTLAGAGAAGPEAPEVRFGPDLEIGPGWVRTGNRRRVHVSDRRTVEAAAQGLGGPAVFVARPWVEAARYAVGDDPHRHGTVFAGKGMWPAEWRAFVEGGEVVGVSSYYAWCGSPTPENAKIALEVRALAQKIADKAAELKAWPRYMDIEFVREADNPTIRNNVQIQEVLQILGRETVSCTLDFIETAEGLMLLEGGPPNTPFGGGHPCGFAGCGGLPKFGNKTQTHGVAFRLMPHVLLGDPSTWDDGDRSDCILSWEEVADLSLREENIPSP